MATLIPSAFCSYQLTDEENRVGSILSPLQKMVIQNLISQIAAEKLALVLNPEKLHEYAQQEAEMSGQILILQSLLNNSTDAETERLTNISNPE